MKKLFRSPLPQNMKSSYSFGGLLLFFIGVQFVSGLLLSAVYSPLGGFALKNFIWKELKGGVVMPIIHAQGASFFFFMLYLHTLRGVVYASYIHNRTLWFSGCMLLYLCQAMGFFGYTLPMGNMSYWAATVICNLLSTLPGGSHMVTWLWGGPIVSSLTGVRFLTIHYFLSFVLLAGVSAHVFILHKSGSSNPLGGSSVHGLIPFSPFFLMYDIFVVLMVTFAFLILLLFGILEVFIHTNLLAMKSLATPEHIIPEWYFLPHYAVLRCVDSKVGGIIMMALFASTPLILTTTNNLTKKSSAYVWMYFFLFMVLMCLGAFPAQYPYNFYSGICVVIWFLKTFGLIMTSQDLKEWYASLREFIKKTLG